jgi:hypothetical protein
MKITTNAGRGYKALTRGLAAAALIGTSSLVMTATATPADAHHGGGGHGWGAVVMVLATVAGSGFTGVATMVAHTITGLAVGGAAAIIAGSVRTTDGSRTLSPTEAIRAGLFIMPVPESFKGRPCTCRSSCT